MGIRTTSRQHEIHVAYTNVSDRSDLEPLPIISWPMEPLTPGNPRSCTSIQSMNRGVTTESLQMRNVGLPPQPPRYGINPLSSNWGEKTQNPVGTCPLIAKIGCPFIHGRTDRMGLTKDKIPHLEGVNNTSLIEFSPHSFPTL
ncbi:hypothetical protein J6590_099795 [Homalodisca vitripennis]|nr:hypothetical protein J6590_099795 [Homalodisca vitripennis]